MMAYWEVNNASHIKPLLGFILMAPNCQYSFLWIGMPGPGLYLCVYLICVCVHGSVPTGACVCISVFMHRGACLRACARLEKNYVP